MSKYFQKIIIIFSFLFLLSSCVNESNYKIFSFFFDGVPNPTKNNLAVVEKDSTKPTTINTKQQEEIAEYLHKPFANKECKQCHEVGKKAILKIDVPDLCYTCHPKFDTLYSELHGPVAGGMCVSCHMPHNSKYKKLLIAENNSDLCYNCHSESDVVADTVHNNQKVCMKCHNPHGGKTNKFLR